MSQTLTLGPNGTDVPTIGTIDLAVEPLHFDSDFAIVEEAPGKVVYADLTAPLDQPWSLRIQQSTRANIYSGTSIDPSAYASSKRGVDTVVEIRGIGKVVDSVSGAEVLLPFRWALTSTMPVHATVDKTVCLALVKRLLASTALMSEDGIQEGLGNLQRGALKK